MLNAIRSRLAVLAITALACLAPLAPAHALDLSLDGNLIGSCGTATASAGAATLANKCGTITTEALTTIAGSGYRLTLTNTAIAAADIVSVTVGNGTNTGGGAALQKATAAAGSVVIDVINNVTGNGQANSVGSFNGTLTIKYFVTKP